MNKKTKVEAIPKKICEYCGKQFQPNHKKQKFCNDAHKQAFHRSGALNPDTIQGAVKASLEEKKEPLANASEVLATLPPWVKEIENFCNKNNCTPKELMEYFSGKKNEKIKRPDSDIANMLPDSDKKSQGARGGASY